MPLSRTSVKACLITNPRSGKGPIDLTDALTVLRARGWDVRVREKRHGGEATELAQAAAHAGCTVVVACAGDGTVSEIVDGLVGTDVAVGVLPGGTANLWAHELGVSGTLRVAALQLVGAVCRRVDVGHVAVNGRHGQHFLLMAGLGLDGAIISRLSKPLKRRIGKLAVGVAALQTLPSYHATQIYADLDGVPWQGKVSQVIAGNTRRYGGFTRVTGHAFIDDGLLDICLIRTAGPAAAGRQLASLILRQRPSTADAELYRGASFTIEAPSVLPLQIDGGAVRLKKVKPKGGVVTYAFTTVAGGITVLVPRAYDGALFQHDASWSARPSAARISIDLDASAGKKPHQHGHAAERYYEVIAVGPDSLTVAPIGGGAVLTVLVGPDTIIVGHDGSHDARGESSASPSLSSVQVGDIVQCKAMKIGDHTTIQARQVRLRSPDWPAEG